MPFAHLYPPITSCSEKENTMSDTLALSLYFLTQKPPEPGWADEVDGALARAEHWLRHDPAHSVDRTRQSLVRRANRLGRNHDALLEQAAALRRALRCAGVDEEALRERMEDFAAQLQGLEEAEAGLVLESVTTDIGVGD
jgi:hypothetical protein